MKKIVTAGDRLYLKFPDPAYFRKRADEVDAELVSFKDPDDEKFKQVISDADALVLLYKPLGREHIEVLEKCRIIQVLQIGFELVDVEAATQKGIIVSNVPAYCTDEVANHAMMLLLALQKNLKALLGETASGGWSYKAGEPVLSLEGQTLGIVGLGRIGRRLVPKAKGFGLNVIAFDPYIHDDIFEMTGVERCYELDDLLPRADYVSLHVPLTGETRHLISAPELEKMRDSAFLINTSRGPVVDTGVLVGSLDRGVISGVGLDVLEKEPPETTDPLLNHPRITVTPHAAWLSSESTDRVRIQGMDEVVRVLQDKRPWYVVNQEVLYRS